MSDNIVIKWFLLKHFLYLGNIVEQYTRYSDALSLSSCPRQYHNCDDINIDLQFYCTFTQQFKKPNLGTNDNDN